MRSGQHAGQDLPGFHRVLAADVQVGQESHPLRSDGPDLQTLLGGGMRQVGVLAAAGHYALDNNIDRMAEDHANAQLIAQACGLDPADVPTNIVVLDVPSAPAVVAAAAEKGVKVGAVGPNRVRLLTHLDISREDAVTAGDILASVLR